MKRLGAVQITQKHLAECLNVASGLSDSRRQAKWRPSYLNCMQIETWLKKKGFSRKRCLQY